jgi:hypothetical protein
MSDVRIAVARNSEGEWLACGADSATDEKASERALRGIDRPAVLHWITATLPVPEAQTVRAEVENNQCS